MKRLFILLILLLALLGACSSNKKNPPMEISSFSLLKTVSFDENIQKAHYHPDRKQIYALDVSTQKILIWKNDKLENVIGGMGRGNSNFQALADFALGPDGSVYALDSSAKVIKRFNADGKYMNSMDLGYVQQPSKLALGTQQSLYVYDVASSEIIAYNLLDGVELYRFGRFQLDRVDQLFANRDFVVAYDKAADKSALYSSLGQFVSKDAGQIVYDTYNNAISLSNEALVSKMSAAWLPLAGRAQIMTISGNVLAIVVDKQVHLLKLDYAPVF